MSASDTYNLKNPYQATVLDAAALNGEGSSKDTRHVVIELGSEGPTYEPGDSLGVLAKNDPALVEQVLNWLGATGEEPVVMPKTGEEKSLRAALERLELTKVPKPLLKTVAELSERAEVSALADPANKEGISAYSDGRDVIDLLNELKPGSLSPQAVVDGMKALLPRLYSIASSPGVNPGQVHLTVGVVSWESHGRERQGVASAYLGHRCTNQAKADVYVHHSKSFKLPEDGATDVIMVGPGTGIAPFRAYLQEREFSKATGRNWLFFGDQHAATDYLYADEFAGMQERGVLNRVDLAFSRDQEQKVYVQHRMLENAAELWTWVEGGAKFYVCGDALRMAKDVDAALHQIIEEQGGMDADAAKDYVKKMKKDKRYLRDVYAV